MICLYRLSRRQKKLLLEVIDEREESFSECNGIESILQDLETLMSQGLFRLLNVHAEEIKEQLLHKLVMHAILKGV